MTRRLISHEPEAQTAPGYVPPAPVVAAPEAQTLPVVSVQAEIPTVLLARHVIEPELLGASPRYVVPTVPYAAQFLPLALLSVSAILTYTGYCQMPEKAWLLVSPFLLLPCSIALVPMIYKMNMRNRNVLRSGVPHCAVVETVYVARFMDGSHKVTYRYEAKPGEFVYRMMKIPVAIVTERGITPGFVFTLLVPQDGAGEPLPYFMATAHRVVPVAATPISQNVSVRVAEADAARLALSAKATGTSGEVEAELLTATPRQVRTKAQPFWKTQAEYAFIAAFATLAALYHVYVKPIVFTPGNLLMLTAMIVSQFLTSRYLNKGVKTLMPAQLLAHGIPTRATVTHVDDANAPGTPLRKQTVAFTYRYVLESGQPEKGWLVLPQARAWQLGLCRGATFTVLYNPKEPVTHLPYFQIEGFEIVGAMGAKITKP